MAAVDITTIGIEYDTSGLDKGTRAQDKTRDSANKLGDSVDKTEKSFSSLNKILGIAAGAMAAVGGVMLAKQFTETADAVSLMDARLKMATGSLQDFKQAQKDIYAISQANNVGIKETTSLYTKLSDPVRRLGGTSKEVAAIVDSFATSLRVGGASAQEASAATLQFAQAMGSGRLQGDEFRSIAEASPRFMKALADGMGVPIEKLKELGSEGKLTADIVGNSLVKSLDQLKKEAAGLPDTVSGAITRFKNDVILAVGEISNSQGFTVGFAGLIEQARGLIPVIKDEVMGAFVAVNGWIERNKEEIGKVWTVAKGIVGDVWEVAKGAFSVAGFIVEWVTQSGLVKTTFETIRLLIAGFQDGVTAIGAGFAYVGSQIFQMVLMPLQKVLETTAKVAGVFDEQMAANLRAVAKEIDDFAKGGENYARSVADAFGNGESAVGRLNAELGRSQESTKEVGKAAAAAGGDFKALKSTVTDAGKESKKLSIEQQAAQSIREQAHKREIELMKSIDKEMTSYAKEQIDRSKEVTKEIISGINDQAKNYLAVNKAMDTHAQRMEDTNELANLEIELLGMSSVERNTLIEQKKIQLALDRDLQKIREMSLSAEARQILVDKATAQANIDKSTAELRAQQGEWTKFYGEIYNGLSDSLYRGFEAGKGFGQSFIDSLKNMLKTNILKVSVQAVMDTGMGFLGGQSKTQESQSGGGGLSSIFSMFGGGGSSAAGGAASMIKSITSSAGIAMAMYSLGRSIAGEYKIGGMNSTFSTLIGSGVGARLFGMADKQMGGQTVTGNLGTNDLMRNQAWTQSGGLLRSDRSGTWSYGLSNSVATTSDGKSYTDTASLSSDKQLLQLLNDNYANVKSVTTDLAKTLGLSAESIATRSDSLNLTLGKTQEETNAAISKVFADIANSIATSLSPSLSSFAKNGESAADTLARLAGSLVDVNLVLGQAGFAKFTQTLEGGNAASRLIELAGGIEKLAEGTQYFTENFMTDAEKIKPVAEMVSAAMAEMGQSSVDTVEEFKLLVRGLDLSTQSGAEMYAKLIAIAPAFKAVADSASSVLEGVNAAKSALDSAKSNYQSALQAVASGLEALSAKVIAAKSAEAQAQNNISNAYFAAQDAVMSAQNRIAELARQSADALKTISGGIKDFVASLAGGAYGLSTANLRKSLTDTAAAARGGDTAAQTSLTSIAQKFLSQSRETSGSALAFARDQSMVRTLLTGVSNSIDKKIVDIKAPAVVDPMVAAQAELVSAQKRLADYSALAAATGANMDRSLVTVAGSITSLLEEYKKTHEDRLKAQSDYSIAQALVTNLGATANTSQTGFVALIEAAIKAKEAIANAQTGLSDAIVNAAAGTQTSVDDFAKSLGLTGESAALLKKAIADANLSTDGYRAIMAVTGLSASDLATSLTGSGLAAADMALVLANASKVGGSFSSRLTAAELDAIEFSKSMLDSTSRANALALVFGTNANDAGILSSSILAASGGAGSLSESLKNTNVSVQTVSAILAKSGLTVTDFSSLISATGLSAEAVTIALGTGDQGLKKAVTVSGVTLEKFAEQAKSAGLTIDEFNSLLANNGLEASSWDGLKALTNSDSALLAEYLNMGAATAQDLSQKFSDVKSASDAIKSRMDAFTLPSVSLDFSGLQSAANSMAQLMAQFKLPVASANDGGSSAGSGGGKSADQMIVESWYSNHPNANKTNDPLGIAYWVSDIQKNGMLNAKRAFADSVAATTGTQALSIEKFATGGTFTNGIVKRPTNFNMGQMGENGYEGVFPVTNVGGKLGVAGIAPKNNDELTEKLLVAVDGLAKRLDKIETNTKESARTLNTVTRNGRAMQTELFA